MKFALQPWQLMLIILAGWINRQQEVIEYLRTENAVLKEKLGKNRILLTDDQRCRLAVKEKISAANNSSRSARCSHLTQSFGGIGNRWPISGTTPIANRGRQVGQGRAK